MAVRAAIGAARGRLVRQFMTESLMLALAGGLLGAILAQWGTDLFVSTLGKPGGADWMARRGSRADIRSVLHEDGGSAGVGPRSTRLRGTLAQSPCRLRFRSGSSPAPLPS